MKNKLKLTETGRSTCSALLLSTETGEGRGQANGVAMMCVCESEVVKIVNECVCVNDVSIIMSGYVPSLRSSVPYALTHPQAAAINSTTLTTLTCQKRPKASFLMCM